MEHYRNASCLVKKSMTSITLPTKSNTLQISHSFARKVPASASYIYKTKESYDQAVKNRKNGQAILQGKMDAPIRCVILNGSLVPDLKYTINSDGRMCVSLRALSEAFDSNTDYDTTAHLLAVPETFGECAFIPAKGALYNISQYFNVNNSNNTFDFISTKPPEIWTDTFALPTVDDVVMPVSDISRILGWEFSYTDNILNVVTDSLDDTKEENLLLIETQTSTESVDLDDWMPLTAAPKQKVRDSNS